IDDRIDVLTRGTQGLSVYCARCHDHKFDPIPTKDYYSLYGIFDSCIDPADKPMLEAPKDTPEYTEYKTRLAALNGQLDAFRNNPLTKYMTEARVKAEDYMLAVHNLQLQEKTIRDRADQTTFEKETGLKAFMAQQWQNFLRNRSGRKNDPIWKP